MVALCVIDERRAPVARIVPLARPLDLHDIRAEIGEQLPGPRAGKNAGEFEDADTGERGCGHR